MAKNEQTQAVVVGGQEETVAELKARLERMHAERAELLAKLASPRLEGPFALKEPKSENGGLNLSSDGKHVHFLPAEWVRAFTERGPEILAAFKALTPAALDTLDRKRMMAPKKAKPQA